MQTFLPYPDFNKTAQCLDNKRLGKQRVEAWQIYQCLLGIGSLSWKNHPAVLMWKGYEIALAFYCMEICNEWIRRGYKDSIKEKICKQLNNDFPEAYNKEHVLIYPHWLGNKNFHEGMRSNLLRKNKIYYSKFNWSETDNLPYIWPVRKKLETIKSLEEVYREESQNTYPYERGYHD